MNIKLIEDIMSALKETDTKYFKIENSQKKIEVIRSDNAFKSYSHPQPPQIQESETNVQEQEQDIKDTQDILSPYIGFFQRSESKGGKSLVKLREIITKGKVVAHIRSMNLQYEVISTIQGKIVEVLVEDGQAVEYGQPLFRLKLIDNEQLKEE